MLQFFALRHCRGFIAVVAAGLTTLSQPAPAAEPVGGAGPRAGVPTAADSTDRADEESPQILLVQSVRKAPAEVEETEEEAARRRKLIEERVRVVQKGTSTRTHRDAAMAAIPFQCLTPENRLRAQQLLEKLSVFRELPMVEFEVHPDVYRFFQAHPDVAVSIWRAMEISEFSMSQTGPLEYEADAGDGTLGVVEVLYRDDRHSLVLCNGEFKSPLAPRPIESRALIHIQTEHLLTAEGTPIVRHIGRVYVSFPSQTVGAAARLISPLSNMIIDRNFREVSLFLHMMSQAMEKQPGWVEQLAGKLEGVLEERRPQLLKLTAQVYLDARRRALATNLIDGDLNAEQVLAPLRSAQRTADE